MVVKAAGFGFDQISRLATLPWSQQADLIYIATQIVLGMGIRSHVVASRIVVYE